MLILCGFFLSARNSPDIPNALFWILYLLLCGRYAHFKKDVKTLLTKLLLILTVFSYSMFERLSYLENVKIIVDRRAECIKAVPEINHSGNLVARSWVNSISFFVIFTWRCSCVWCRKYEHEHGYYRFSASLESGRSKLPYISAGSALITWPSPALIWTHRIDGTDIKESQLRKPFAQHTLCKFQDMFCLTTRY